MPQGSGTPGWLVLTRDKGPIAYFVARTDSPTPVPVRLVWDTRCFEDTVLRVEKTPTHLYLADVWMLNGTPLYECSTFKERQDLLQQLFEMYTPCPAFESLAVDLRTNVRDIRGKEYYTTERGALGVYVETKIEIARTDVPDVYRVVHSGEYLRVPTLVLSRFLAKQGASFWLACKNNRDGTWTVDTSSNPLTNED